MSFPNTPRESRVHRFGSSWVRPGLGIGTVLVLASLALAFGRASASDTTWSGSIHVDDLLDSQVDLQVDARGGLRSAPQASQRLAEVPRGGLQVDLWSDPTPGSRVRVGQKGKIFFEANADCFVTILSVDTEGRTTRLFPKRRDDGWVWGGETYRLPDYGSGTDLRFTGPEGVERVFAIATLDSQVEAYPRWLERGHASSWSRASCTYGDAFYETGWLLGDPLYALRDLTTRLVSYPEDRGSYHTAWANFYVGRSRSHWQHSRACASCGGLVEAGRDGCGGGYVNVVLEPDFGWIDFSVVVLPRYHYRACRTWRPRLWVSVFSDPYPDWRWCDWRVTRRRHGKGRVYLHDHHGWHEPNGRWRKDVERRVEKAKTRGRADATEIRRKRSRDVAVQSQKNRDRSEAVESRRERNRSSEVTTRKEQSRSGVEVTRKRTREVIRSKPSKSKTEPKIKSKAKASSKEQDSSKSARSRRR